MSDVDGLTVNVNEENKFKYYKPIFILVCICNSKELTVFKSIKHLMANRKKIYHECQAEIDKTEDLSEHNFPQFMEHTKVLTVLVDIRKRIYGYISVSHKQSQFDLYVGHRRGSGYNNEHFHYGEISKKGLDICVGYDNLLTSNREG